MQEQFDRLKRYKKPLLLILSFALVLLIGWLRFLTGPEFAFSFLYLVPIVITSWMAGRQWGVLISAVSAFSWLLADICMSDQFSQSYIPIVNETFRLTVFLFIVFIIARNKQILENQQELATLDPLTGAANRRAFFNLARTEIDRSRRYGHPFSVMVIDIDDFKQVNDTFGHHVGDRLLSTVVETIKNHVRAIDIVARFGGDEFVILLVRTDERSASLVARKLQTQLLNNMRGKGWTVTFSMGLATYHSVPESVDETVRAADQLMYQIKHNGKNGIKHAVLKM
ncbi:GGDEF domain-containing protein [Desulfosarcina ovata]|uniref:diguanylate cyclase n=2 Tax=Desulfosarcina ovata TaxID=83564 RepID=A0A5K8A9F0_9BACT|nr:GGDEF domain-containing protein [Desulfosarcina ovata]BBO81414.1 hypothetical protein DSCO28_19800 [Desulfosarcina ovata subsp. sediminis]BBO88670.1 hypothetical protein DSCOOX_18500 [Desulfosarcina ovata subsp. ovata]